MIPEDLVEHESPEEAFLDENLSKLGDSIVNFIYSLARSRVRGEPDGAKVPNEVLSNSLSEAGLRYLGPSRTDSHRLGDIAEAIVGYAWLNEEIDIEEGTEIISEALSGINFERRSEILSGAEEGFKNLLVTISKRVPIERN